MNLAITYLLYPVLLIATVVVCTSAIFLNWDLKVTYTWLAGVRLITLLGVEYFSAFQNRWSMTRKSFFRDLKYMIVGGGTIRGLKNLLVILAIDLSQYNTGLIANTSIFTGFILTALVFEFVQYWIHRISHEGKGRIGTFLWRVHVAHHLPDKVYLIMHAVMHPINSIFIFFIMQVSLVLMGARAESIFLFFALLSLHGLISHFNVEIKAGFLNYIFVGTELHRFHHSADPMESKNYGVFLTVWDHTFGTFYYDPDVAPGRLGVQKPDDYPDSDELIKVLSLPFRGSGSRGASIIPT